MTALTDPSTYPISTRRRASARAPAVRPRDRRRGRAVARRRDDAGDRSGDRRAGRHGGRRLGGGCRARRPVRARSVRRRSLAVPGAARAGAAAAPARRADRRARGRAGRARRDRLRPAADVRRIHRPVRGRGNRVLLRAGRRKLHGTIPAVPREFVVHQVREPVGVVGSIVPWNGPHAAAAFGLFPLCAGNSVVLKPAEQTPMSAVVVAELALEAGIPPGVFNVVQGVGETVGAALVAHPDVDVISFTGSGATGRAIQAAAAARVKRVCLELGGKSPLDRLPGCRPRRRRRRRDDGRVGSVGTGLHVQHARARARARLRRGA